MRTQESDPERQGTCGTAEAMTAQANRDDSHAEGNWHRPIPLPGVITLSVLLASVALFYTATIRDGNYWSDDYALYVHHAQNIAEGRSYADTGHVYNRDVIDYSPSAYPPLFPLFLAPIYRAYGLNLHAMKIEEVGFLLLTLLAVAAYWKHDLRWPYLVALIGILGFNPYFWELKDSVISDFLFLLFFYLTALVAARAPRQGPRWPLWAAGSGVLLYCCVGTRIVGLTLVAGLVLYEVVKHRKLTRFAATAVLVCFLLFLVQLRIFGSGEQSYTDQLHTTLRNIWVNGKELIRAFITLWGRPWGRTASLVLFAVTTGLAVVGAFKYKEKGLTTVAAFLCFYLPVVLIPGPQGLRYLLPLIPFYVFLMLMGLQQFATYEKQAWARAVVLLPLLLVALSYGEYFRHAHYGLIRQSDGRPSFNELCVFLKANTKPSDVIIFRRCRALSLFTSRPAALYDYAHPEKLPTDFARFGASYVVASPIFEEDREFLIPFIDKNRSHFDEVYENSDFKVYRVRVN